MNYKVIFNTLGRIVILGAILMALPLIISLLYAEYFQALSFGIVVLISFGLDNYI